MEGVNAVKFDTSSNQDGSQLLSPDIRGIQQRSNGNLIIATFGGGIFEFVYNDSKFHPIEKEPGEFFGDFSVDGAQIRMGSQLWIC